MNQITTSDPSAAPLPRTETLDRADILVEQPQRIRSLGAVVSKNVAVSLLRVGINALVALVLPAYLTHRLPVSTYGAWVLILQMGAYVSFLDFGIQTGVAKFVAEYEARGDESGASQRASCGLVLMAAAAVIGVLLTLLVVWQVPRLFHDMPRALYADARVSLLLVGCSMAFGLVCSVFSAIFIGLQQYEIPVFIAVLNRSLFTIAVCVVVFFHGSLTAMGVAAALVNIAAGILQIVAWHLKGRRITISLAAIDPQVLKQVLGYCSLLAFWSVSMLCISGLDLTIVGHYDFRNTAYYSLATLPSNLMIMIVSAALNPLMPAASAFSIGHTAREMGNMLCRTTRYSTALVLLTGLPLMVLGYQILRLWVGTGYASRSVQYLQVLVLATIVRNLLLPFATIVVATGKQRIAITAGVAEALVNLGTSIYLVQSMGAMGVALGTLIGAFVGVLMHFVLTMRYTFGTIEVSRGRLILRGLLRPSIIAVPSALLALIWSHNPPTSPAVAHVGLLHPPGSLVQRIDCPGTDLST